MHHAKSKAILKLHNAPIFKNLLNAVLWATFKYSFNLTQKSKKDQMINHLVFYKCFKIIQ
ncbi:hypothetical protein AMD27_13585 [Acinetobacter sp. TGL-Y2]|nr:hypothetical protein AMD27_13585 [Acinetobacter sp. TGL-Y2]